MDPEDDDLTEEQLRERDARLWDRLAPRRQEQAVGHADVLREFSGPPLNAPGSDL